MLKGIIFDFDGVIAESVQVKTDAFSSIYKPYGKDVVDKVVNNVANEIVDKVEDVEDNLKDRTNDIDDFIQGITKNKKEEKVMP